MQSDGRLGAVQLWQSWARMETLRGRVAAARELYKRASGLFPEDAHLLIEWGKLCSEERDVDAARSLFSRVLALRTPPTYGYQCAAALEAREGNAEAARALYEKGTERALARLPTSARGEGDGVALSLTKLLLSWAVFEWRQGEIGRARALFKKAEMLTAATPSAWLFQWRARFEGENGQLALSRHYYARAANVDRTESSIWKMWAEVESEIGDAERAALYARLSLRLEAAAHLTHAAATARSPLARGASPDARIIHS